MQLIGITGPIGHGKSALVHSFKQADPTTKSLESSTIITEAANHLNLSLAKLAVIPDYSGPQSIKDWLDAALPDALRTVTPLSFKADSLYVNVHELSSGSPQYEKLAVYLGSLDSQPAMLRQAINTENKDEYRPLLQWVGGYVTTRLDKSLWYEEMVRRAGTASRSGCELFVCGGVRYPKDADVLRAAGGSLISISRPDIPVRDAHDPTEQARQSLQADSIVLNDGSLEQLDRLAAVLLGDLRRNKLLAQYQAKAF